MSKKRPSFKSIQSFLAYTADVETVDKDARTPLHDAARAGTEESRLIVVRLLERGADVKAVDKDGRTPLHDAARVGTADVWPIVRMLVLEGADIHAADQSSHKPLDFDALPPCPPTDPQLSFFTGETSWRGLRTWRMCDGFIENVLSVSRPDAQSHCFVARTVSAFVEEFYAPYGVDLLQWIKNICQDGHAAEFTSTAATAARKFRTMVTLASPSRSFSSGYASFLCLTGYLKAERLFWTIVSDSAALAEDIKAALRWILSVLESPFDDNEHEGIFTGHQVH
jgi:hypothetical protein